MKNIPNGIRNLKKWVLNLAKCIKNLKKAEDLKFCSLVKISPNLVTLQNPLHYLFRGAL